jgi:hypothetical protein
VTFEQFSAVVTPQRCMIGVKVVGAFNLGMAIANGIRLNGAQLGFNIAGAVMCVGSYYMFREILVMMKQNQEMKDIRIGLEADIWEMEHPTEPRVQ